jgi:hypothetical protein
MHDGYIRAFHRIRQGVLGRGQGGARRECESRHHDRGCEAQDPDALTAGVQRDARSHSLSILNTRSFRPANATVLAVR